MRLRPTPLSGVYELRTLAHEDHRGAFRRSWCQASLAEAGIGFVPLQASLSDNHRRHTLRGMHWQAAPAEEQKLVGCVQGQVWDVVLDLRPGSATWGRHWGLCLSAEEGNAVFIPRGCAHGFLTLCDQARVSYLIDTPHAPEHARGLRWDDPAFAIAWPAPPAVLGERDQAWPMHHG